MAKRPSEEPGSRAPKRTKLDRPAAQVETVTSARQMQTLLTFQQDAPGLVRNGLRAFKAFLESIAYTDDKSSTALQQQILRSYLESQSPKTSTGDDASALPHLMQAWSFASQTNDDGLISAIAAVLALLLKTISSFIDFRDLGLQLCRSLLQRDHLRLISQALSAPRQKEHVISPSLRLLTELVKFDGGTLARKSLADSVKSYTFDGKILARNLSLWKYGTGDAQEDKRRVAVRSNAVRYLLAHFKYQGNAEKVDILKYGNVIRALFEHIQHDPVDVLEQTFSVLRVHILEQQSPSELRRTKGALLNERNLASIASLYRSHPASNSLSPPTKLAHHFLLYVCTTPEAGVVQANASWYPPGVSNHHSTATDDIAEIDLGLDSVEWYQRYRSRIPVRNHALAGLAQALRPTNSNIESELLLAIFRAAPELVADYFQKNAGYSSEPKLTATWVGYSALLYSVTNLPLPDLSSKARGYQPVPPPLAICIDNILPRPLTQKALTRCLNQQVELITLFAVRILTIAFQKLHALLTDFRKAGRLWEEGAEKVLTAFSTRCPSFKDVAGVYRSSKAGSVLQEAVLRLLALYYELTPELAAEENFDITTPLSEALGQLEWSTEEDSTGSTERCRLLNLNHMLRIAERSSDMHWFNKTKGQMVSPITIIVRLLAMLPKNQVPAATWGVARKVLEQNGILQPHSGIKALSALAASLRFASDGESSINDAIYPFLDDCMSRLTRKPIKYEDDADQLPQDSDSSGPVSLLHLVLLEQWPYAAEREASSTIARWIRLYLHASRSIALEDERALAVILVKYEKTGLTAAQTAIADEVTTLELNDRSPSEIAETKDTGRALPPNEMSHAADTTDEASPIMSPPTTEPPEEHPDAPGLHRWSTKDISSAVSDGDLAALILCLSSQYPEVRPAALRQLRILLTRIGPSTDPSPFEGASQIWVLLGTLVNTVEGPIEGPGSQDDDKNSHGAPSIPSVVTTYASLASRVLMDPMHPLYTAINEFHLNNGPPKWNIEGLARYWTHTILYTHCVDSRGALEARPKESSSVADMIPTALDTDGQRYIDQEVANADISTPQRFLLNLIYLSLRTERDLDTVRQYRVLEPLLSMASSPHTARNTVEMLLRILWRITFIPGGSDMLITRKSIVAWLAMRLQLVSMRAEKREKSKKSDLNANPMLHLLVRRILETCDQQRAAMWGGDLSRKNLERLAQVVTIPD